MKYYIAHIVVARSLLGDAAIQGEIEKFYKMNN